MAYPFKHNLGQRSIGYYSCAEQMVNGRYIGRKAANSTDWGADNCSIINKNIGTISKFGTPNPVIAKRRPPPYQA